MSERIVNALAEMKQVYLQSVAHNNLEQQHIDEEVRQINAYKDEVKDSEEAEKIKNHMSSLIDDKTSKSQEAVDNVLKALQSIGTLRPPVAESSFYSWRDEIGESVLWEINDDKLVKEKKVNNYSGTDPVVTVNPELKTESVLVDTEELDEDFIEESIDIATEILLDEGLDEDGIYDLIEELGQEEFYDWVLSVGYENLELIERRLRAGETAFPARTREKITGKKITGKPVSDLKGAAAAAKERSDEARRQARAAARETPEPTERQKRLATLLAKQKATPAPVKPATPVKATPAPTKPTPEQLARRQDLKNKLARMVLSGWEGHKKAMETKRTGGTTGEALRRGFDAAGKAFRKKGTDHFREWVENLLEEGYDLSDWSWDELYEEYECIMENEENGDSSLVEQVIRFVRENR